MTTIADRIRILRESLRSITGHTATAGRTVEDLAAVIKQLRAAQAGNPALAEQRHAFLDADPDTRYPAPGDVVFTPPTDDQVTRALVTEVIKDVTQASGYASLPIEWEVGSAADGLPLVSGRLKVDPDSVERLLIALAGGGQAVMIPPGRHLIYDDPARITVEFTWPEPPGIATPSRPNRMFSEARPTPRAWVQIWAPAPVRTVRRALP